MSRIIQIVGHYAYGDAIGNHINTLHRELIKREVDSRIYCVTSDKRRQGEAHELKYYDAKPDDIILYHLSTGSELNRQVAEFPGKLLINYHNITPPKFFTNYHRNLEELCEQGYDDVLYLRNKVSAVVADSQYNLHELEKMGYTCPMKSIPIFMDFSDYDKAPNPAVMKKYNDGKKNILFVGRIAPNKKQEDVIRAFYYYTKHLESNSRLIIVGSYNGLEQYYLELKAYVKKLGLKNVVFTGHTSFPDILAYYRTADLFLCQSEHEGFCVPLVEAMYFGVPIVTYDSSAIGETLGQAGVLLRDKDPMLTATVIDCILSDENVINQIRQHQKEELKRFDHKNVAQAYVQFLLEDAI